MSFKIPDYNNNCIENYLNYEKLRKCDGKNNSLFELRGNFELESLCTPLSDKLVELLKDLDEPVIIRDSFNIDENFNVETTVVFTQTDESENIPVETEAEFNQNDVRENINIETFVEFCQLDIIYGDQALPEKLSKINLKFDGLCELICNKILIDDLLGKGDGDFLKEQINIDELNKDSILESHLLNVFSVFSKMLAFVCRIYPDNIFSVQDQWNLVHERKVNEDILFEGLEKIEVNTTLKLEIFKKTCTKFSGHSLLIKKTDENEFTFFDPGTGEHRGLSQEDLATKINEQLELWKGTDIFISRGDAYIKRLRSKHIIDKAASIIISE